MTTVYLIRHGQASFGQKDYDQLSEKGQMQSNILGQYLDQIIDETPYVIAGSMKRHQQTATLALQNFSVPIIHTDATWNEFDHQQVFSQYNPRFADPLLIKQEIASAKDPQKFMMETFNLAMQHWINNKDPQQYTESWLDFNQRIDLALNNLGQKINQYQPKQAVVFSSGGVISVVIAKILGLDQEKTAELIWTISNASITTLHFSDQGFDLIEMNEYHYLQTQQQQLATWV